MLSSSFSSNALIICSCLAFGYGVFWREFRGVWSHYGGNGHRKGEALVPTYVLQPSYLQNPYVLYFFLLRITAFMKARLYSLSILTTLLDASFFDALIGVVSPLMCSEYVRS